MPSGCSPFNVASASLHPGCPGGILFLSTLGRAAGPSCRHHQRPGPGSPSFSNTPARVHLFLSGVSTTSVLLMLRILAMLMWRARVENRAGTPCHRTRPGCPGATSRCTHVGPQVRGKHVLVHLVIVLPQVIVEGVAVLVRRTGADPVEEVSGPLHRGTPVSQGSP